MSIVNVKQISHVALKTQNVERQTAFYTNIVGLGETARDLAGRVYLRCNANHHAVVLVPSSESGVDHYALDVGTPTALENAAVALDRAGIAYESRSADKTGQGLALRLRDPDGFVIELIGGMEQVQPTYGPRAVQPRKLGHITLLVDDCRRSAAFYSEVLGFRVSNWLDDTFLWMRCNPDHHGIAFAKAGRTAMHHLAFEVLDFSSLARQADHLMHNGYRLFYGPGRHGPGQNQFAYFKDSEGNIIEFMCDLEQIWDDDTYEPKVWSSQELWVNLWGPDPPADFV
ncbi:MAG TPA: VOC family protein [Ktedonosporobacter sp.]|nr:VOC family protein [Ktedonosporobacter sp.]